MSLLHEVGQSSYKNAINKIAKKVDELNSYNSAGKYEIYYAGYFERREYVNAMNEGDKVEINFMDPIVDSLINSSVVSEEILDDSSTIILPIILESRHPNNAQMAFDSIYGRIWLYALTDIDYFLYQYGIAILILRLNERS